jgi:Glycosyltransferase WbsX
MTWPAWSRQSVRRDSDVDRSSDTPSSHGELPPTTLAKRARAIAFYLPQFYPNSDNDTLWGPGFTEWVNVVRARPLFPGHRVPIVPGALGFYDLRLPETRIAQAQLAEQHGVEGFCYWHYWFAGRRVLDRPFREVLESGEPRFPFCLGWANHSWTGVWYDLDDLCLIEQTYPGPDDHEHHFEELLPAFLDDRYVRVDGKPLFVIYRPTDIPELGRFVDLWQGLAHRAGLPGFHMIGLRGLETPAEEPSSVALDGFMRVDLPKRAPVGHLRARRTARRFLPDSAIALLRPLFRRRRPGPHVVSYESFADQWYVDPLAPTEYPCVFPNWDNTARSGVRGVVLFGSNPEAFRRLLRRAIDAVASRPAEKRLVFLKSWNEWAEGNYLEPDRELGTAFLEVVREEVLEASALHSIERRAARQK